MSLKVLIVDDTVVYRKIMSDVLAGFPNVELTGTAPSGAIALKKMAQTPVDLVFLDVFMPEMDGVETLKRIKAQFPDTFVVMVSGLTTQNAEITIRALEIGAVDFIRKPDSPDAAANAAHLHGDVAAVLRLIELKVQTRQIRMPSRNAGAGRPVVTGTHPAVSVSGAPARPPSTGGHPVPRSFAVCAIGVSTGGPEALGRFIPALPANFPVPVLLVQHMPPMFTKSLADSLGRKSKIRVCEAQEGQAIETGMVYIAPGGRHMIVRSDAGRMIIGINDEPPENSCRPAVDVLFRSVAAQYGDRGVLAAVFTGMGSDGCSGMRALKRKSCYCITQTEPSCVVYGMPRAVDEAGLSDHSLPLEEIAPHMVAILGNSRVTP